MHILKKDFQIDASFEALANQHRREIICALSLQPYSISKLASMRKLSLPAIHKHIEVLEIAKLINRKKIGRTYFISLSRGSLKSIHDWILQFHPFWGNDHESLENYHFYLRGGEKK